MICCPRCYTDSSWFHPKVSCDSCGWKNPYPGYDELDLIRMRQAAAEQPSDELRRFREREPLVQNVLTVYADTRFLPVEHAWSAIEDELDALRNFDLKDSDT